MPRESLPIEPRGVTATARHYIRDLVYGANDGIITTFAVVGAGTIPLLPFVLPVADRPFWATVMTFVALFVLGGLRAIVTTEQWWRSAVETLLLGALVALAASGAGALAA